MSKWKKEELENMLEDVVNELELSESAVEKHGQLGTTPAELVRLVLDEKDLKIRALEANFVDASKSNCNLHSVSKRSEPFRCFEIHYPNIPANGCTVQCKECAEKEKQLNGC